MWREKRGSCTYVYWASAFSVYERGLTTSHGKESGAFRRTLRETKKISPRTFPPSLSFFAALLLSNVAQILSLSLPFSLSPRTNTHTQKSKRGFHVVDGNSYCETAAAAGKRRKLCVEREEEEVGEYRTIGVAAVVVRAHDGGGEGGCGGRRRGRLSNKWLLLTALNGVGVVGTPPQIAAASAAQRSARADSHYGICTGGERGCIVRTCVYSTERGKMGADDF